jgi:hypothetical protein
VNAVDVAQIKFRLARVNRLARQEHIGVEDAHWLETWRSNCKLAKDIPLFSLISQLQDIFGLQLVAERLTT